MESSSNQDEKAKRDRFMQSNLTSHQESTPPRATETQMLQVERTGSFGSSSLNKYLNHNKTTRTNQLEPVRQGRRRSTHGDGDGETPNQDDVVGEGVDVKASKEETQINIVLNSQKFQYLGSQLLQEEEDAQKPAEKQESNETDKADQDQASQPATTTPNAAEADSPLPKFGTEVATTPITLLTAGASVANQSEIQLQELSTTANLEVLMRELNPAVSQGPLQSPPVDLLMQQEDHKLLQLYQAQTQELLRIAGGSSSPLQTLPLDQKDGSDVGTHEQSQQINMPELNYSDEPFLGGIIRINNHQQSAASKWLDEQRQQLEPKLTEESKKNILKVEGQLLAGGNRFTEESTLSKQTIKCIQPPGKGDDPNSQHTLFGPLQKVPTPTVNTNQQHDPSNHTLIRDEAQQRQDYAQGQQAMQDSQSRLILGMFDVNKSAEQSVEPNSPVRLRPRIPQPQPEPKKQQVLRRPQPHKPAMVEKNFVGGGVGKYGMTEDSSKRAKKNNEPTFPAFFTKAVTNNRQQQSMAKQELKFDQNYQHPQQQQHQQQTRGKSDVAFQRGTICLNSQEQSIENMELVASIREQLPPQLLNQATLNSSTLEVQETSTTRTDDNKIAINVKQYQPIRLQSVSAPLNYELTDPTVSLAQIDNNNNSRPSLVNQHNNYKVSYLNKPSAVFNTGSSVDSASQHNLGGEITEGGIIVAINQDSKLSFKDYVELHQGNVSGRMTIEETTREITRDGLTSTVTEEIFLLPVKQPALTSVATTTINAPPMLQAFRPKKLVQSSQEQIGSQPSVKKIGRTALLSHLKGENRNKKARGGGQSLQPKQNQKESSSPDEHVSSLAKARLRSLNKTTRIGFFQGGMNSPSKKVQQPLLAQGLNTFRGRTTSFQPDLEVSVAKAKYDSIDGRRGGDDGDTAASQKTVHYGGKFHVDIRKRAAKKNKASEIVEASQKARRASKDAAVSKSPVIKPKYFATITTVGNNTHQNRQAFPGVIRAPSQLSCDDGSVQGQQISASPAFMQTMQTTIDGKPSQQFVQPSAMNNKMSLTVGPGQFLDGGRHPSPQKEPFYSGPWIRKKTKQSEPVITAQSIIKQKISPYHQKVRKVNNSIDSSSPKRDQKSTSEMVLGTKKDIVAAGESPRSLHKNDSNKFQLPELISNKRANGGPISVKKRNKISRTILTDNKGSNVDLISVSNNEDFKTQIMGGISEKAEIDSILSPEFMNLVQESSDFVGQDFNSLQPFLLKDVALHDSGDTSPKQERRQVIKILDQAKWKAAIVPSDQQISLNTNGDQMLSIELQQKPLSKVSTVSRGKEQSSQKKRQYAIQATEQNEIINVLQETSLHMDSVFDTSSVTNRLTPLGSGGPVTDQTNKDTLTITNIQTVKPDAKRTKSSFQKSKELIMQSLSSTSQKDDTKRADLMLEQTELAMQELIAKEMIQHGKGSIDSTQKDEEMSANNRVGASVIFAAEEVNQRMNSTEFSQFIKHQESIDGASSTRQDFGGQAQVGFSNAMYQTAFQDMAKTNISNGEMLLQKLQPKIQYFAPNISKKQQQGLNQYPVSFHQKSSLPVPLEKLKIARHLQLRNKQFNQTAGFEIQQKRNNFDQHRTKSLVTHKLPDKSRQANFSLTTTRFSQHHRALSELRSFQKQLHIDQSEHSPPPLHLPPSSTHNQHMTVVQETLQVRKQPWGQKTVSPQRQRQMQERNGRIESLRLKQDRLNKLQHKEKEKENTDLKSVKYSIALESGRDLSTNMGQHESLLSRNHTPMEDIVKNQTTPAKQVIVNTSTGLNTAYLPSPAQPASPTDQKDGEARRLSMPPPQQFALQQSKRFGSVLIEKSVLPERRKYHIKGDAVGVDKNATIERKKDRNNFKKQSQHEDSPKSYKMPANFPPHHNDSQLDSVQGPESIEENKSPRMPVHSFTQNLIGVKTHSSQVPNRRRIMGDTNKLYNKGQAKHKDLVGSETVIRGKTLRLKDAHVSSFPDALKPNQLQLSLENSQNEMPERYVDEDDSIQNINQVQDLLEAVEKEVGQKKNNADSIEESIEEHGQEIDTINNSQMAEFSALKSQIGAGSTSDGRTNVVKSPELTKKVNNIGRNVLLSSAQTLEGSHNQQNGRM